MINILASEDTDTLFKTGCLMHTRRGRWVWTRGILGTYILAVCLMCVSSANVFLYLPGDCLAGSMIIVSLGCLSHWQTCSLVCQVLALLANILCWLSAACLIGKHILVPFQLLVSLTDKLIWQMLVL